MFKPYALFDKQGIKIAVIGLTTDDTAKMGNPEYFTDIEFRVPAPEAKRVVEQLRKDETGRDHRRYPHGALRQR